MSQLMHIERFTADYERLQDVALNPDRHAAGNVHEHCEMVRTRVVDLAKRNDCDPEQTMLLEDLARVHDIGKIHGTAKPQESVALLESYGVEDQQLAALVKYHDTNLPWYKSAERGQPPSDKAWRKLVANVDLKLLCLFMVADRVDCPGGWRGNPPLVWFLEQVDRRELLNQPLDLDDGPDVESSRTWN